MLNDNTKKNNQNKKSNENLLQSTNPFSNQQHNYKGFINYLDIIACIPYSSTFEIEYPHEPYSLAFEMEYPFEGYISHYEKPFYSSDFCKEYNDWWNRKFFLKPKLFFIQKYDNSLKLIKQLRNGYLIYYKDGTVYINNEFNKQIGSTYTKEISLFCELKNNKILIFNEEKTFYIITIKKNGLEIKTNMITKNKKEFYGIQSKNAPLIGEKGVEESTQILTGVIKDEDQILHQVDEFNLILELDENEYIISIPEGTFYFKGDIFYIDKSSLTDIISKECYSEGTIIEERFLVLINSKKGILHLYDIQDEHKIVYTINNLSPIINKSLSVIKLKNNKIILLGYKNSSINGILAIKIKLDNNNFSINHSYNPTDPTELGDTYFCPLKNFQKSFKILDINYNELIEDTNYILVGGKGFKIYMVEEENISNNILIKIYKLRDIEINNFEGNIENTTCIKQLYGNGNVMIGHNEFYMKEE